MSKYLVRVSKSGPSAHVWTGDDTACRMWKSGGLKANGVRLAESQMGHRLCKLCADASGLRDEPGRAPDNVNRALIELPSPPGCGFVDTKKQSKSEAKKARKAQKAAALAAKLAKGNNWTAKKPTRLGLTHDEANAPEFLSSYAWRSLRFKVLQHYGARCMCCGATPETGAVMNVDHIKPRRTHPHLALEFENLQVLCHDCNHGKANTVADFRPAPIEPEVREFLRAIARQ